MAGSFQEFVNENALRKHPLAYSATLAATNGVLVPNDFLVAASISVQPESLGQVFISSIRILPSVCQVVFSRILPSSEIVRIGTCSFSPSTHEENSSYSVADETDGSSRGIITVGKVSTLLGLFSGDLAFSSLACPVEVSCQRPIPEGVTSIRVSQGGVISGAARGAVVLIPGENVRLSRVTDQETGLPAIRIDAIIPGGGQSSGDYIRFVNGQAPDSLGNIEILGGDCIAIETIGAGKIEITTPCKTSCCDCDAYENMTDSLQEIKAKMERLAEQYLILQDQYQKNLTALTIQMQA